MNKLDRALLDLHNQGKLSVEDWQILEAAEARDSFNTMRELRISNPPCYPGWAIGKAVWEYIPACARLS